ncbi:hypothetical protein QWY85_09425 [Neolewinella lacunae]|uniref:Uncharacterized protein n=1 Tax=Neolewinella lacunae TaxID=1517758 RepID=A0A923PSA4_9BACT|nr:hypothetical protein [Neolewinella lacunae]MBC6996558.1 hypothetical protein [Neolewinella lacunae]MDN3634878.1 hypothetical protein [Neolewinella lacunae]
MTDPEDFINALELAPLPDDLPQRTSRGLQNAEVEVDKDQAFINNKSLVSFAAGISPKYRQDVLDSTLLASLAADRKFPDNSNPRAWYDFYVKVLSSIGWTTDRNENKAYTSAEAEFDVNQAVIEIMTAIAGGPGVQAILIAKTLTALKGLADEDGKIRLFEKRAKGLDTSNFQVGVATESAEAVSLNVSNFYFENIQGSRKVIFFRWGGDRAALNYQFFQGTLNTQVYADSRPLVKQKIAAYRTTLIDELDL